MSDFVYRFLTQPEQVNAAIQAWISDHAVSLSLTAAGMLAAAGVAGFAADMLRRGASDREFRRKAFGTRRERVYRARRAGLLRNPKLTFSGIPIGKIGRRYLVWTDQEPLLVTSGTRSGKGVGIVRPACLTYGGPLISYDGGKGETFRDTSGWRSRFSHVLNFDLTNPVGVHFNFLDEVRPETAVADADNIAKAVPRAPGSDPHFEDSADRLIGAAILHVLHGEPNNEKNMAGVVRLISQGDEGMRRIYALDTHPVAASRVSGLFSAVTASGEGGVGAAVAGIFAGRASSPLDEWARKKLDVPDVIEVEPKAITITLAQHLPMTDYRKMR